MEAIVTEKLPRFLEILGLNEELLGVFYSDREPTEGFSPGRCRCPPGSKS